MGDSTQGGDGKCKFKIEQLGFDFPGISLLAICLVIGSWYFFLYNVQMQMKNFNLPWQASLSNWMPGWLKKEIGGKKNPGD